METGGALWFENLCMADPFYLLPLLTSSTLYLQVLTDL
jgi:YidC/Oxa1 family membrane protein insertase